MSSDVLPPTPEDKKLSVRHHVDSVNYNLHHSRDHFDAIPDHLAKMHKVAGPEVAARQARKVASTLAHMQRQLAPYLPNNANSAKIAAKKGGTNK